MGVRQVFLVILEHSKKLPRPTSAWSPAFPRTGELWGNSFSLSPYRSHSTSLASPRSRTSCIP